MIINIFCLEISEEKSRNQTLEQELMEAKITIQELRKHQLQPQESYYQNHSNQYESDSISGRSTPEPKPIIGKKSMDSSFRAGPYFPWSGPETISSI